MKRLLLTTLALAAAAALGAGAATFVQQGVDPARAGVSQAAKIVLHVNQNDPAVMNLALNNAQNVASHYKAAKLPVTI